MCEVVQGEPKPKYKRANLGEKNQLFYDEKVDSLGLFLIQFNLTERVDSSARMLRICISFMIQHYSTAFAWQLRKHGYLKS